MLLEDEEIIEEEVQPEPKSFEEMTDDEKLALPDDEFMKAIDSEDDEEEEEAEETDSETVPEEEVKSEPVKSVEEKLRDGEEIDPADLEKATAEQRGRYYSLQKERQKRHELERDLAEERKIREAQMSIIEKMRLGKQEEPEQFTSEYDRVVSTLEAKAKAYEAEYGEEYRLTFSDTRALDQARQVDATKAKQAEQERSLVEQRQRDHQVLQRTIDESIKSFGEDDFEYVYKTFVDKVINPQVADDPEIAKANAMTLFNLVRSGKNPADYAYNVLAKMTPEGRKYFQEKEQKQVNKRLVDEGSKKTTKTSTHIDGGKTTDGRTRVTISMVDKDFNYWEKKLTNEQFSKVVSGQEVFV